MSEKKKEQQKTQIIEVQQAIQQVQNEKLQASQYYQTRYLPVMEKIQRPSVEKLECLLKRNSIQRREDGFRSNNLQKICAKTNWQSFIYKIKLGKFQGEISVLKFNVQSQNYIPKIISKGQFGSISLLKYENKQYALKCIKTNNHKFEQIQHALAQVFLLKIASALQTGPHLENIFGYDVITFTDCIQVAMQFCKTTYTSEEIRKQLKEKNLFKNLKILHSLGIIHKDIKYDNIGFSRTFNKFIFLDFGFSKSLQEPLGSKSLTIFEGTFNYCSEEMKKLYFLRGKAYVDLYYNDLYCLQKTILEFQKSIETGLKLNFERKMVINYFHKGQNSEDEGINKKQKNFINVKLKLNGNQSDNMNRRQSQGSYADVISYFRLKYYLFLANIQQVKRIVQNQVTLLYTFKKILFQQLETHKKSFIFQQLSNIYLGFSQFCQKIERQSNKKIEIYDALIYDYLFRMPFDKSFMNYQQKLYQIAEMQSQQKYKRLSQIWGKQEWMQEIFYFVDVDLLNVNARELPQNKKKFLKLLYKYIKTNIQIKKHSELPTKTTIFTNYFRIYRQILLYLYYEHFLPLEKLPILEKIQCYFIIFNDNYTRQQMEIDILKIYEKDTPMAYLYKNMEYIIGKSMMENIYTIEESDNVQNMEIFAAKFKEKSKETHEKQLQLIQYIKLATQVMKMIRIQPKWFTFPSNIIKTEKIFEQFKNHSLTNSSYNLPNNVQLSHFISLISLILKQKQKSCQLFVGISYGRFPALKQLNTNNYYLNVQLLHWKQFDKFTMISIDQLQKGIQNLTFNYFIPFSKYNEIKDRVRQENANEIIKQSMAYYLSFHQKHNMDITQVELLVLIRFIRDEEIISEFLIGYFYDFDMKRVKSFKELMALFLCLMRVFCVFGPPDTKNVVRRYEKLKINLGKFAISLNQFTDRFSQQSAKSIQQMNYNSILVDKFESLYLNVMGLAKTALRYYAQAANIFMKISQHDEYTYRIHLLCQIQDLLQGEQKEKVSQFLKSFCKSIVQNIDSQNIFLKSPQCFQKPIELMLRNNERSQAFKFILKYLKNIDITHPYSVDFKINPIIKKFLEGIYRYQLTLYIEQLMKKKEENFNENLAMYILLFDMFVCYDQGIEVDAQQDYDQQPQKIVRIILQKCAFGFEKIQNCSLCLRKQVLMTKIIKYFKFHNKIPIMTIFKCISQQQFERVRNEYLKKLRRNQAPPRFIDLLNIKILIIYNHNYFQLEKFYKRKTTIRL